MYSIVTRILLVMTLSSVINYHGYASSDRHSNRLIKHIKSSLVIIATIANALNTVAATPKTLCPLEDYASSSSNVILPPCALITGEPSHPFTWDTSSLFLPSSCIGENCENNHTQSMIAAENITNSSIEDRNYDLQTLPQLLPQTLPHIHSVNDRHLRGLAVIGEDSRKVATYEQAKTTGKLLIPYGESGFVSCTGTLISSRFFATAAHCFIKDGETTAPKDRFFKEISFTPNYRNGDGKKFFAKRIYLLEDYVTKGGYSDDIAIVELNEEVDSWQGVLAANRHPLQLPQNVYMVAYDGDHYRQQPSIRSCQIKDTYPFNKQTIYMHDCDSYQGSSGAGISIFEADVNGNLRNYVVAINTAEHINTKANSWWPIYTRITGNVATPLTKILYSNFILDSDYSHDKKRKRKIIITPISTSIIMLAIGGGLASCLCCYSINKACHQKRQHQEHGGEEVVEDNLPHTVVTTSPIRTI